MIRRWQTLKTAVRRWMTERSGRHLSQVVEPPDTGIHDGVDYRLPVSVPSSVLKAGTEAVNTYLSESGQSTGTEYLYRGPFDKPYRSAADTPVMMPMVDPLLEWDYQTRLQVITNCHAAYHRNPVAKRAVNVTRQFAVGKGHTVTCQNAQVQKAIDVFRDNAENNIQGYERTFLQDLMVDGELMIEFFTEAGQVVIVPRPPWWVFDVNTDPDFFRRVRSWKLRYTNPTNGKAMDREVDAANMLHVPINNHSYELRGRPDLFAILPWLKAYKDWLEDRFRQNKWRGALLWVVRLAGATKSLIATKATQYRKPPTPGSIVVSSDKEDWSSVTNPVAANDASEDGRQFRMMCATGTDLPEYMLGDGENANLATATAQQLPSLWKFTDAQQIMAELVWTPVYKRVIQEAIANGDIEADQTDDDGMKVRIEDVDGDPVMLINPEGGEEEQFIDPLKAFSVEYYELQSDDPKTLAEALAIDMTGGLVSIETARGKRGYEHPIEEKRIAREEAADRDKVAQGLKIEVPNPPFVQNMTGNGNQEETPPESEQMAT